MDKKMKDGALITTPRCPKYGEPWVFSELDIEGIRLYGVEVQGRVLADQGYARNLLVIGRINCLLHGFSEYAEQSDFEVDVSSAFDVLVYVLGRGMRLGPDNDPGIMELITTGLIMRRQFEEWCYLRLLRREEIMPIPWSDKYEGKLEYSIRAELNDVWPKYWIEELREVEMGFPGGGSLLNTIGGVAGSISSRSSQDAAMRDYATKMRAIEEEKFRAKAEMMELAVQRANDARNVNMQDQQSGWLQNGLGNASSTITTTGSSPYQNVGIDPAYGQIFGTLSPSSSSMNMEELFRIQTMLQQAGVMKAPQPAPAPTPPPIREDRTGQPLRKILPLEEEQ